jgi:uncharacterized protein (TIGR03435 family)
MSRVFNAMKELNVSWIARAARKLDFSRKPLLITAGLAALALPILLGIVNATQSQAESQVQSTPAARRVYDVASIKPNKSPDDRTKLMYSPDGLTGTNVTGQMLLRLAYGIQDNQISGAPTWFNSESYNLEAKMDSSVADEMRKISEDQRKVERQQMLQALLADRFKLTVHRETKDLPVYALVIAKNGPKLQKAKPGDTYADGFKGIDGLPAGPHNMVLRGRGEFKAQAQPISALARALSHALGRPVLDKTGLTGEYDIALQWTPESQTPMFKGTESGQQNNDSGRSADSSGPSIFTAIQEQLGLKLESQKGSAEMLVIDHVDKPSEN